MAMDLDSWHKNRDGIFGGTLYMLPDRGWNTQGTVDYRGRLHRFEVTLDPLYSGTTKSQNQLQLKYKNSAPFHWWGGIQTTGLDPTGSSAQLRLSPTCRSQRRATSASMTRRWCMSATAQYG